VFLWATVGPHIFLRHRALNLSHEPESIVAIRHDHQTLAALGVSLEKALVPTMGTTMAKSRWVTALCEGDSQAINLFTLLGKHFMGQRRRKELRLARIRVLYLNGESREIGRRYPEPCRSHFWVNAPPTFHGRSLAAIRLRRLGPKAFSKRFLECAVCHS
jgi:hypothetical protein